MPGQHGKKKGPNPKKLAAAEIRFSAAFEGARSGALRIGLIIGCLGNKSFRVRLSASEERTVAICGKVFQGGEHSASYARRGDWLIVSGTEVQGVLNGHRSSEFAELRAAGLVPDVALETPEQQRGAATAAEGDAPEGFAYEKSEDSDAALARADATWTDPTQTARSKREAEQMESRVQQARELVARIRARQAGLAARAAARPALGEREDDGGFDLFGAAEAEAAPAEEDTEAGGAPAAVDPLEAHAARKQREITSVRRLRKLGLLPAEPTEEERAEAAAEEERARLQREEDARLYEAEMALLAAERAAAEWAERNRAEFLAHSARAAEADWEELAGDALEAAVDAI
jgi:hypothetical protein